MTEEVEVFQPKRRRCEKCGAYVSNTNNSNLCRKCYPKRARIYGDPRYDSWWVSKIVVNFFNKHKNG